MITDVFSGTFIITFLTGVISSIVTSYVFLLAKKKLPIAHNIAVIGFPRSGKTTLITTLFAEIFSRKITSISISPRGEETINRVNDDIARLERGHELGPTTDQDLFAYRAEMVTGKNLFSKRYKIEIGDFPGEDSENLSAKEIIWLHQLPFFKWVLSADAFIFVVDSEYFIQQNITYKSNITKAFRAAWQKLKDHHYDGMRKLNNKPIVVVFTKIDLLISKKMSDRSPNEMTAGFQEDFILPGEDLDLIKKGLLHEYTDLINYLKAETTKFKVVFSSSFAKNSSDGIKVGVKDLLQGVLPE